MVVFVFGFFFGVCFCSFGGFVVCDFDFYFVCFGGFVQRTILIFPSKFPEKRKRNRFLFIHQENVLFQKKKEWVPNPRLEKRKAFRKFEKERLFSS